MRRFGVVVIFLWTLFCLHVGVLLAIDGKGVTMSPPFVDVQVDDKNAQKDFVLEIGNNSQSSLTIDLSVVDFGSLDESGGVAFLSSSKEPGDRKYALASWMSLEKDVVQVEPGKKEKVKITILNKESLVGGGHYGAVLATVKSERNENRDMVGLNQSLASLIYVQKTGGEKKSLILKNVDYKKSLMSFPKTVNIRFENNGNVHLTPRGKIEILGRGLEMVSKGVVNENSGRVIPESFRVFVVPMKLEKTWIWPGKYNLVVGYRFDGKEKFSTYGEDYFYFGKEGVILITVVFLGVVFFLAWKRTV